MGQQQLLLVILVTIIVGIATVVAINTFSSASDSANLDAVRQDMLSIASSAQQYYMKPEALGGGGNDFEGITVNNLGGVPGDISGSYIVNENGSYSISPVASNDSLQITGYPSSDPAYSEASTSGGSIVGVAGADEYNITQPYTEGSTN
jgi:type II secretory pathway pseudopilin PulG